MKTAKELVSRLNNYFAVGGIWNPELMDHDLVRDLLRDCRDYLIVAADNNVQPTEDTNRLDWLEGVRYSSNVDLLRLFEHFQGQSVREAIDVAIKEKG